jgi:DNA-3-methyladenine glycosylase II
LSPVFFSDEALEHLRRCDDTLRAIIDERGPLDLETRQRGRPEDPYGALLRSIVGQQLSVAAARTIYGRLTDLLGAPPPPRRSCSTRTRTSSAPPASRARR